MRAVAIILAAALAGCAIGADIPAAQQGVADFRAKLDAGKFAEIYRASSKDLRDVTSEAELVRLLEQVHGKLGGFREAKQTGWLDQTDTGGHFITLNFDSTYAKGKATEEFIYRIDSGKAALAAYKIDTP